MNKMLMEALKLKQTPRAGWSRVGIEGAESVADHSWGVAMLALALCPRELDLQRCLALAILHDIAEVHTGDIVPGAMPRAAKMHRERLAAADLLKANANLWGLWEDYEKDRSPEAHFIHQLDKLDMALQAVLYSDRADTSEFVDSARKAISDPRLLAVLDTASER